MSAHENEYHDNMVAMLELVWGEGYMAPGGPGNVARLLDRIDARGKRILDVGCGIGGPAFEMVRTHGAEVVGIDLEAPLIERAAAAARQHGLEDRCQFRVVETGRFPFPGESFDIVLSSGAVTQTSDTAGIIADCLRVLKPGGYFTCYEWMRIDEPYSDDMLRWLKLEELTYVLETIESFAALFRDAGFVDVEATDASGWYRRECRREYELIRSDLYPRMVELLGQEDADHFVENWQAMTVVCESGEMRQAYFRGRRPA
ncbi:MAG: methyltransferase domain-containing protein [Woeseiaceae bacterium]|nr:methyltransferase domain-containing protein [Woeseiaceae bacterium]